MSFNKGTCIQSAYDKYIGNYLQALLQQITWKNTANDRQPVSFAEVVNFKL
jgi:hypothetical protein